MLAVSFGCVGGSSAPKALSAPAPDAKPPAHAEPEIVDDFALLDHKGEHHQLHANADARAVVLVSFAIGCPIQRSQLPSIEELSKTYAERGVRFFYVDAGRHDDRASLAAEARDFGISVPILMDETQLVLSSLHVRRTAEAILIDPRDWHVAYRGAIDDRATYGGQSTPVEPVENLGLALDAFLEGREIAVARTATQGCAIFYEHEDDPTPSYSAVIVPILARRCLPCHSAGGIAPWAMDSFDRVHGWSPMIRESITTKRMPPWHADPHIGTFANDRSLALEEASALVRWVDAGAPRGDGPDELPALHAVPRPEWPLGEPDIVVETRRIDLPDSGVLSYFFDTVELRNTEELWVRATDMRPSNQKVLHHAQVYVRYPREPNDEPPESKGVNVFCWYTPGSTGNEYPKGAGKRIPAGAKIVFELHYTTTGKPESDSTKLALYLHDEPPPLLFESMAVVPKELRIPAFEPRHVATIKRPIRNDVLLHSMGPHMHFRGSAVDYRALYPDGTEEILLSVPRYDFNWQTNYRLAEPKLLPAGTTIVCRAVYDNSPQNPFNPDPTREVVWGRQSTDEMFIGALEVHDVVPAVRPASSSSASESSRAGTHASSTDSE